MLEMGLSGLMSGDGKRGGAQPSATASILDSTRADGPLPGLVRDIGHHRRRIGHFNMTEHPTAGLAGQ